MSKAWNGETIERCLDDLENRIDPEAEDTLLQQWVDFSDGTHQGDYFMPRRSRKSPPKCQWPTININDAQDHNGAMLLDQYAGCSHLLEGGGGMVMTIRSNYGTCIMPSLFGAELFVMDRDLNTLPTSRPLDGLKEIKAIIDRGIPDLQAGLGAKVFEMGRRYMEVASRYPKISKYVRIYHPDMQGPMDILELLWGSRIFLDVFDHPDLVHALLRIITDTYVLFMQEWNRIVPLQDGYGCHWGLMFKGKIMLRDDSAMNFSPEMYDEFIRPYDAELLEKLGGGAVHFCGRGDHYIESASSMKGLSAINMSQPECNDMETIFRNTVDKGIKLLRLQKDAADAAVAAGRDLHGCVQV
jgi:hypothetical protein